MRVGVATPGITQSYKVPVRTYRHIGNTRQFYERLVAMEVNQRRPLGRFRRMLTAATS